MSKLLAQARRGESIFTAQVVSLQEVNQSVLAVGFQPLSQSLLPKTNRRTPPSLSNGVVARTLPFVEVDRIF